MQDKTVVLVVEDEPLLRLHVESLVEEAGCDVVSARNADEAIAILLQRLDIRLVVTDIEMPGAMDGIKLARAIRDRWPPIDLILMSGHKMVSAEDLPARGRFFSKPLPESELVAAIRGYVAHH